MTCAVTLISDPQILTHYFIDADILHNDMRNNVNF